MIRVMCPALLVEDVRTPDGRTIEPGAVDVPDGPTPLLVREHGGLGTVGALDRYEWRAGRLVGWGTLADRFAPRLPAGVGAEVSLRQPPEVEADRGFVIRHAALRQTVVHVAPTDVGPVWPEARLHRECGVCAGTGCTHPTCEGRGYLL